MPHRRPVDESDAALFLAEVADARPLCKRTPSVPPPATPARRATAPTARLVLEGTADAPRGRASGVSRARLGDLAAGRIHPEATLDLHGLREADAPAELRRFLSAARAAGRRCVLVITGKGLHSNGPAALRTAVPQLLAGPLAQHVRAFAPACARDGGAGALYVLLPASSRGGA